MTPGFYVEVFVEVCGQVTHGQDGHDQLPQDAEWQGWFARWVTAMAPTASPINQYALGLQFTTDAQIQHLNGQYRDRDQPTDVLAFAALEASAPQLDALLTQEPLYLGDLVISLDTAQRQAQVQGHPLTQELLWLATHGLLHLLGWDHPNQERLSEMLDQQACLIQLIDSPRFT